MTSPLDQVGDLTPAGPRTRQRGIRLPQLLLSLLVVAVFALLAVWWQANTTSREPVVALANDVEVGVPLTRADLTEIYISSDIAPRVEAAEFIELFVGKVPVTSLEAGTLITGRMFRVAVPLTKGQAFVGLQLDATQAPPGLVTGDRVQVLAEGSDDEVRLLAQDARVESVALDGVRVALRLRMGLEQAQRVQLEAKSVVVIKVDNTGPASWENEDPS